MKSKSFKMFAGLLAATLCVGMFSPVAVRAEGFTGWKEENGNKYWYENDVKQGTEGRGKEIYDPASDAWYWLDAPDGIMARSKDVYQESDAGEWGDLVNEDGVRYGKWVRYDENGHMIKGWATNENGTYYFDYTFGTMAKGKAVINGVEYYFNQETGILEGSIGGVEGNANGWRTIDGIEYWYENGVRQGTEGRGKEIYDPASDAWYWLDSVDAGKKAVSKDVYQESKADDAGTIGKWVRYDANGHMIKGWDGDYYFDPVYGTMAKGYVTIDGKNYYFNETTGVCEGEIKQGEYQWVHTGSTTYNENGTVESRYVYEYDDDGNAVRTASYIGNKLTEDWEGYSNTIDELLLSTETMYEYDGNGNVTSQKKNSYSFIYNDDDTERTSYLWSETAYTFKNGEYSFAVGKMYDRTGKLTDYSETTFNDDGNILKDVVSYDDGTGMKLSYTSDYEYDGNGYLVKITQKYVNSDTTYEYVYENDAEGRVLKETTYTNGTATHETVSTYSNGYKTSEQTKNIETGRINYRWEYDYDANGNQTEYRSYYSDYSEPYELYLSSRTTYEYNAAGDRIGSKQYSSVEDYGTGERTEYQVGYSVTTYVDRPNYSRPGVKEHDSYYGHYNKNADGTVTYNYREGEYWAYQSGYSYDYNENGARTKYYRYTRDENYEKITSRWTEYNTEHTFSPADMLGKTDEYTYSTTYDKDGNRISYEVETYRTVRQ